MAENHDTTTTSAPAPRTMCEVWVSMNEDGFFEVGTAEDEAAERCIEQHGGHRLRSVMLEVTMAPPAVVTAAVQVPDEAGQTVDVRIGDETDPDDVVDPRQTD